MSEKWKGAPERAFSRINSRIALALRDQGLGQTKHQPSLYTDANFFLARSVGRGGPAGRANGAADQRALTAACQPADERAARGAAADNRPIALLVRATLHEDTRSLHRHGFSIQS